MHALYGFARYADDLIDSLSDPSPQALLQWSDAALAGIRSGRTVDPVVLAVSDTLRRWAISLAHVEAFLDSMRQDISVTSYATYADLELYMYGSAAVIGLQMVPILEPLRGKEAEARACAQALGEAFQLTNFIRDVAEDLDRGRVYLPLEDLERFAVTRADLERRVATPAIRGLVAFECARARRLYGDAAPGVQLLHPTSRDCIRTALALYGGILDRVAAQDYDVFAGRARVPVARRLAVAGPAWARAVRARRAEAGRRV